MRRQMAIATIPRQNDATYDVSLPDACTEAKGPISYYETSPNVPHPLGAVPDGGGVNFTIFSQHATSVELLLFTRHDDQEPFQIIPLDPARNKTFHFWHVYVKR